MDGMKYVIYDDDSYSIFPPMLNHSDMRVMGKTPVSAGFLRVTEIDTDMDDLSVSCFGESVTLNLKSRMAEDEAIIRVGYSIACCM